MKKIILTLIISLVHIISWSQQKEFNKLMMQGDTEFTSKNYVDAKQYYEKALGLNSKNKVALYNLAVSELYLENTERACELFHDGYRLKDIKTRELILKYCGRIKYNKAMFLQDVDGTPQFEFNGKLFPLMVNNKMNPKLISLFQAEVKKSKILRKYKGKRIYVNFRMINSEGYLTCKTTKNYLKDVKPEIERIFNNIANYTPLTYEGRNVDVWGMGFTIFFQF